MAGAVVAASGCAAGPLLLCGARAAPLPRAGRRLHPGGMAWDAASRRRRGATGTVVAAWAVQSSEPPSRRQLLGWAALLAAAAAGAGAGAAPGGAALAEVAAPADSKRRNLPIEEIKDVLKADLGERMYFVTGQLTTDIFDDNCRFKDPTTDVRGVGRYLAAVRVLFDPANSSVTLKDIAVTSPSTIEATWTLQGYLKFPWHPYVKPFDGRVVYTVGADGLVVQQEEEWGISGAEALWVSIVPTPGPPA